MGDDLHCSLYQTFAAELASLMPGKIDEGYFMF
jgi:hypothetical protein